MIDFVNIGGKSRPVKFGMNALRVFTKETGVKMAEIADLEFMKNQDLETTFTLLFLGLREGMRAEKQAVDFGIEDVCDWLDEEGKVEELFNVFTNQWAGNPTKPVEGQGTGI